MSVHEEPRCSLQIRMFGPFDVRVDGQPLAHLRTRKGQWLLALLAMRHGKSVSRDWLAGTLWPDSLESQGLAGLRKSLTDLRGALGEEARRIESPTPQTLLLNLNGAFLDIREFDTALTADDPIRLEHAIGRVRGPFLEGCDENWALEERLVRDQALLGALEALARAAIQAGKPVDAAGWLRRVIAIEPLREEAQRGLMEALAATGEFAALTQVYRELRLYLHREHNAEPDPQTSGLYRHLQRQVTRPADPGPVVSLQPEPPLPVRPLPRPLTQLIGRDREVVDISERLQGARLVTLTGSGGVGKTRLALRAGEIAASEYPDGVWFIDLAAVQDPEFVVQRVAEEFAVPEATGSGVLEALVQHLQRRALLLILDNCEQVAPRCAALADALLRGCRHLRILATSRQPLSLTGEAVMRVPSLSLPDARTLRTIARINATGSASGAASIAAHSAVATGSQSAINALLESDAVRLFTERARDYVLGFELTAANAEPVARICLRLDGIPLALELAAARVRSLSPPQILQRLDDRFRILTTGDRAAMPRQQTLQALIDWSYDLLPGAEQLLLQRLSVFAGGWTLDAAEQICSMSSSSSHGASSVPSTHGSSDQQSRLQNSRPHLLPDAGVHIEEGDVLDLLTSLVDKSLVVYSPTEAEGRYRLLETIRQYAAAKLQKCQPGNDLHSRFRGYYLAAARNAEPHLTGPEQGRWLAALEAEHENMRAALSSCLLSESGCKPLSPLVTNAPLPARTKAEGAEEPLAVTALQFCVALWWFWDVWGYLREGRDWIERALAVNPEPSELRAQALIGLGTLARLLTDTAAASNAYQESLRINGALSNQRGVGGSLISLGNMALSGADYEQAQSWFSQAAAVWEELGDAEQLALVWNNLGYVAQMQGNMVEARRRYEGSLEELRRAGDPRSIAVGLYNLAELDLAEDDLPAAARHLGECLDDVLEIGDRYLLTFAIRGTAAFASANMKWDLAVRLMSASEKLREEIETPLKTADRQALDSGLATARQALDDEAYDLAWTAGQAASREEATEAARSALN